MLESLVKEADLGMLSAAMERIMRKQGSDSEKSDVLQKSVSFGAHLREVAENLSRQQSSLHNSAVWPLTQDLTVKVNLQSIEVLMREDLEFNEGLSHWR